MSKKFKVVMVGCGHMAHTWLEYALTRPDTEMMGLVDLNLETARELAARHGLEHLSVFDDLAQALSSTGANLVFDASAPQAHHQITHIALEAGCDVFGEKPMATSILEAQSMVLAAQTTGKTFAVMQNRRYQKPIRALRTLVQDGTIGVPGLVSAEFFIGAHFGGFRDAMDSPLLLDMAIHTFDQARFIVGRDPVSVYCHEYNPTGSWYTGKAAASCIFEFEGGVVFTYNGSWCAEGARTSWDSAWRVVGSQGTAIWNGTDVPYAEVVADLEQEGFLRDSQRVEISLEWQGQDGHYGALDEMFTALLEKRAPETVCTDNIKSMGMVFGAVESARIKRKVHI